MWRTLLHFVSFRGCASRREYAAVFAVTITAGVTSLLIYGLRPAPLGVEVLNWTLFYLSVAVSVRRLHDLRKSAWLLLTWPITSFILIAWFLIRLSRA
jgi:uncharacterized membrane protein YhaH (DUF805 family)